MIAVEHEVRRGLSQGRDRAPDLHGSILRPIDTSETEEDWYSEDAEFVWVGEYRKGHIVETHRAYRHVLRDGGSKADTSNAIRHHPGALANRQT